MNEETIDKANELLLKMLDSIDKGSEFVVEKAPEVVQQLLIWESISSLLTQILCIVIIATFPLSYKFKQSKPWHHDFPVIVMSVHSALCVFSVIGFLSSFDWLKIWVAPDLYLLEYAAKLMG